MKYCWRRNQFRYDNFNVAVAILKTLNDPRKLHVALRINSGTQGNFFAS